MSDNQISLAVSDVTVDRILSTIFVEQPDTTQKRRYGNIDNIS